MFNSVYTVFRLCWSTERMLRRLAGLRFASSVSSTAGLADVAMVLKAPETVAASWVEKALSSKEEMKSAALQLQTTMDKAAAGGGGKPEELVRSSPQGLDLLLALRATIAKEKLQVPQLDSWATGQLKTLCGRQMLQAEQLSLSTSNKTHIALLEQAKASETVQKAASEDEFRRKLGEGRRVHALVNKAAPNTLLGILYSAVTAGLPSAMRDIEASTGQPLHQGQDRWELTPDSVRALADSPSAPRDTCAFYSVSTPHPATKGLRLGTRIIYDVAQETAASSGHQIKTFTTLSPVPGFTSWLAASSSPSSSSPSSPSVSSMLAEGGKTRAIFEAASAVLGDKEGKDAIAEGLLPAVSSGDSEAASKLLVHLLRQYPSQWYHSNAAAKKPLEGVLVSLGRSYLLSTSPQGSPLCAVAHFHLGNGASMGRILWGADEGIDGLKRSGSLMVNYVYSQGKGLDGLLEAIEVKAPAYSKDSAGVLKTQNPVFVGGSA